MGADLLLISLVHDENTKLDWAAGRKAARKLDRDALMRGMVDCYGEEPETVTEARSLLNGIISSLKQELTSDQLARDAHLWSIRGATIHIRGGTSWGDDPSDGWTVFANAWAFPKVLDAIGFETKVAV